MYLHSSSGGRLRWLIKTVMSGFFYYGGVVRLFNLVKVFTRKGSIRILTYHSVRDESNYIELTMGADKFHSQMGYLVRHYRVIRMEEAEEIIRSGLPLKKDVCVITFDDGYRDNYLHAYPVLKEYRLPATVYLATEYIRSGRPTFVFALIVAMEKCGVSEIDLSRIGLGRMSLQSHCEREKAILAVDGYAKRLSSPESEALLESVIRGLGMNPGGPEFKNLMLSWEEVREMSDFVTFGGHTRSHPHLPRCDPKMAHQEIRGCKEDIEEQLQAEARFFAYPYGGKTDINHDIMKMVKESGYSSAVVLYQNPHRPDTLYALGRGMVSNTMVSSFFTNRFSEAMFACEMSGLFEFLFNRKND